MGRIDTAMGHPPLPKGDRGDLSDASGQGNPRNPSHPPDKGGGFSRRAFLIGMAALVSAPAFARAAGGSESLRLAASWESDQGYQVGILVPVQGLAMSAAIDVPTRAHGLLREPGGTLLAVARRPGDWLLRWDGAGRALAWRWIEPRRAFSGHVLASADGRTLYTTEMDLDTGAGLIGVREAASLEKRDEWPTHGIDAHQLLWDSTRPGCLIVANGGVPTQPETGRSKRDLERMDSSLACLDAASGALRGQWRLDDPRLSLRHLAWNGPRLGVALQAEHDTEWDRGVAPVLALFDGATLRAVAPPRPLAGYGGDVAAAGAHFAVSCPRAQGIALFTADGAWQGFIPLDEACALAASENRLWAGGRHESRSFSGLAQASDGVIPVSGLRLDNHWLIL